MYVLPQLTNSLKSQNEELVDIKKGISGVNASFSKWFKTQERQRLDNLEKERDAKAEKAQQKSQARTVSAGVQAKSRGNMLNGMGGRLGALAGGLGIGGLVGGMGGTMGKLGLFGAGQMFAGTIGQGVFDRTGNADLAAAAENMTRFAAVGSLFGKRFALLGGVAGALATPENMEVLKSIGSSLGEKGQQVIDGIQKLGITLPSLSDTYQFISDSSNKVLKGIESFISGDVAAMRENVDGIAAIGGAATGRALMKSGTQGMKNPVVENLSKRERIVLNNKTAKNLSGKQLSNLAKQGITVNSGGMMKNGKFMTADAMDDALKSVKAPTSTQSRGLAKALAKYKNFGKALKLPIIGPLISAGSIGLVLSNEDLSAKEKTAQIAGIFGSIGGGVLGTAVGSLLGSVVPGFGTIGGGLVGGILGAFGGDYLAQNLAEYLMGETSEIEKLAKDIKAAGANSAGLSGERRRQSRGVATAIPATQGATITDGTNAARDLSMGSMNGSTLAVNAPNTNNVSNNTNLVSSPISPFDTQDQLSRG